ncbi:MAG: toxin-antitoxin system YwqK family antitoxin [Bacteroidia bacterium]
MKNYPVLLSFIFCVFISSAQDNIIPPQWIYINFQDYTVKAQILSSKAKIKINPDYTYTWFAFNKVMLTKGSYDGKLLDGIYKSFYLNNNLKEQGHYNKGLKWSKWMGWYNDGKVKETSHWKNGALNGIKELYNTNGELTKSIEYKDDVIHGDVKTYEKGKLISKQKFKKGVEVSETPKVKKEKAKKQTGETKQQTDTLKSPGSGKKEAPAQKDSTTVDTKKEPVKPKEQGNKEGVKK